MKQVAPTVALLAILIILEAPVMGQANPRERPNSMRKVPTFRVDPTWPQIPNNWVLGDVSSVSVDAQDHVWVLHRPRLVRPAEKDRAAPPVLEFDAKGNFIQ